MDLLEPSGRAEIRITAHARMRAGERCPFRRTLAAAADKAFDFGLRPEDVPVKEARRHLESHCREPGAEVRVHGGYVFCFGFEAGDYWLVTLFPIAEEFRQSLAGLRRGE